MRLQRSRELRLSPPGWRAPRHLSPVGGHGRGARCTRPGARSCRGGAWAGRGPSVSGAGPRRPGLSGRLAMGEAGPGPGPGPGPAPRETPEPEEDEAAALGGARGGRAGPRGGIRVLRVRKGPRPPPLPATRWGGGESAPGRRGRCPSRPWPLPSRWPLPVRSGPVCGRVGGAADARVWAALQRNAKRTGSRSCQSRSRVGSRERTWLKGDVGRGCVYVYGRDSAAAAPSDLRLVLCTVDTQASEICDGEGRKNLFLQLHGDLVR